VTRRKAEHCAVNVRIATGGASRGMVDAPPPPPPPPLPQLPPLPLLQLRIRGFSGCFHVRRPWKGSVLLTAAYTPVFTGFPTIINTSHWELFLQLVSFSTVSSTFLNVLGYSFPPVPLFVVERIWIEAFRSRFRRFCQSLVHSVQMRELRPTLRRSLSSPRYTASLSASQP